MIFVNQDTAKQFRGDAEKQLVDFIADIAKNIVHHAKIGTQLSDDTLRGYAESRVVSKLPASVSLLLYRSGIVFPASDGQYPVIVYYDNDSDNGFKVSSAMRESRSSLIGGIVGYQIHT